MSEKAGSPDGQPAVKPTERGGVQQVLLIPRSSGDDSAKLKNVFSGHRLTLCTIKQSGVPNRTADNYVKMNNVDRVEKQMPASGRNCVQFPNYNDETDSKSKVNRSAGNDGGRHRSQPVYRAGHPDSVFTRRSNANMRAVSRRQPQSVPSESSLTLMTILSMLCDSKCQGNKDHGRLLFDYMCTKLRAYGVPVLNNVFDHETLSAVRSQFYSGFETLIVNFVRMNFGSLQNNPESGNVFPNMGQKIFALSNSFLPLDLPINFYLNSRRYTTDFEEIGCLGNGAFGKVYKVRHKFDTRPYAVKKIPVLFRDNEDLKVVQREVQLIANLQHTNIVGYFNSWYETYERVPSSGSNSPSISHAGESGGGDTNDWSDDGGTWCQQRFELSEVFERVHSTTSTTSLVQEDEDRAIVKRTDALRLTSLGRQHCHIVTTERTADRTNSIFKNLALVDVKRRKGFPLILYIQMELCAGTLEQYLERRNNGDAEDCDALMSLDSDPCEKIFYQIVSAVEYIHSKGVMHRDLKPSNIFINDADGLVVKIGDFGLARPDWNCTIDDMAGGDSPLTPLDAFPDLMTADVGTKSYAAPEQLLGSEYDQKADMYSLGIIGFEIFYPMRTISERVRVNGQLRERCGHTEHVEKVAVRWPHQAALIRKLLSTDPNLRPSAKDVMLAWPAKSDQDVIREILERERQKDDIIDRQAKMLSKNKKTISRLRGALVRLQQQLKNAESKLADLNG